jgi:GH35 family endo-1,4-beta-xylanase
LPARRAGDVAALPRDYARAFALGGIERELGRLEVVQPADRPFPWALRCTTPTNLAAEPNLELAAAAISRIRAGDVLLARFWLRCHESMSGEGYTTFAFEPVTPDKTPKPPAFRVGAASDWREVHVPFQSPGDYDPGEARVCFRLGFDRQVIDIGGIELLNYGGDADVANLPKTVITYAGRQHDAPWRHAALNRIEAHRKADLAVRVTNGGGKPVAGAAVRLTLRRHAFGFGSAVTVEHLLGDTDDAEQYRQIVERHFNTAVFENDMKWPENYDAPQPGLNEALDWLLKRQFRVRGHNLIWPSWRWLPKPLRQYADDPEELRLRAHLRITQAIARYRSRLVHWDVVNEPYSERDLIDILGGEQVMVDWFKLARQADPKCRLYLNDYGIFDGGPTSPHRKHFYDTIQFLLDRGAPIDGIGIQSHFLALPAPPERILSVLDQFSEFGLPIESTELSLNMPDRSLQADYMRDYLTAVFSHPNVDGVMLWGFWAGRHWRPDAALYDADWTPRAVAHAWIDLVHRQWKTDVEVTTDEQGLARARGFCGEYDVIVSRGSASATADARLGRTGGEVSITLVGDAAAR